MLMLIKEDLFVMIGKVIVFCSFGVAFIMVIVMLLCVLWPNFALWLRVLLEGKNLFRGDKR